ncbi:MAG: D-alanyl-D-alanine carboxypeptidase/D-alanyl-D-alanine-endopeptidase [Bacteroidetes bacterium]|nr:D-alanyl-D-alanine carboxypeptidase/D-alanyl-D-alanine-endopeptidase [Bacteroidota bacterium]
MITRFKILLLVAFSLLLQSCATFKPEPNSFENQIDSLLVSDLPNSTQAAISVYDLTENKSVYTHNEKLLLRPASNQKILTTSATYLFLGSDYNFETKIVHTGTIADSVLCGDLYFIGGLDPAFTTHNLDSLVREIKKFGIKEINGNVYGDVSAMDSLFWGEGWMWDDDPYSFAAYMTPLNINKNSVAVVVSPSQPGGIANVETLSNTNSVVIKNSAVTTDTGKTKLKVTRDWLNRKNTIFVSGTISRLSEPDTIALNVFNPTFYFLQLAEESFKRNGVELDGKVDTLTLRDSAEVIASSKHSIESVINYTNKNSYNLGAEMLLRALALKYYGKPASAKNGIKLLDSLITLSGLDPKKYSLVDGSGLSFYNLVSTQLIMNVLKYLYLNQPEIYKKIYDSFPVSGTDGSLKNRMKNFPIRGQVHAKTGTISGVSCLSGYIQTRKNHTLAFSVMIQNYTGNSSAARKFQDKICEIIFNTN